MQIQRCSSLKILAFRQQLCLRDQLQIMSCLNHLLQANQYQKKMLYKIIEKINTSQSHKLRQNLKEMIRRIDIIPTIVLEMTAKMVSASSSRHNRTKHQSRLEFLLHRMTSISQSQLKASRIPSQSLRKIILHRFLSKKIAVEASKTFTFPRSSLIRMPINRNFLA